MPTRLRAKHVFINCPFDDSYKPMGLGEATKLPRFNMPLELGLFLGCKNFGSAAQRRKSCLILDSDLYRYRVSISDIAGLDIQSHQCDPMIAIAKARNWLANKSRTRGLPGAAEIGARYATFKRDLVGICRDLRREPEDLTFADFSETVERWLTSAR